MSKKRIIEFIVLAVLLGVGFYLKGFWGGCLAGASMLMLLLATLGQWQLNKAAKTLDNKIKNRL
jgi:cytochrome oxidase assembly protein ShyY1